MLLSAAELTPIRNAIGAERRCNKCPAKSGLSKNVSFVPATNKLSAYIQTFAADAGAWIEADDPNTEEEQAERTAVVEEQQPMA